MKQLGYVLAVHSEYDDRLWNFLKGIEYETNIEGYVHAKLFPYFLMAGASIKCEFIDDEVEEGELATALLITIEDEKEELFYKNLIDLLDRNIPYEWRLYE